MPQRTIEYTADVEAAMAEVQRLRREGFDYDALKAERNLYAGLLDDLHVFGPQRRARLLTQLPLCARVRAVLG